MILANVVKNLAIARSGVYFLESLPFAVAGRLLSEHELAPPSQEEVKTLWKHIVQLHEAEKENLKQGLYPVRALDLENPLRHARSYLEVLGDGVRVAWRMRRRKTREFSPQAESSAEGMPDYYTRNFHFQTDGYFSEASARRYDHQVEILFSGTAGAMRRSILPVLKKYTDGEGRWLELACGAGSATRAVAASFPKARLTALDLSRQYLKVARENLRDFEKVDFVQGDATKLEFREETFDAVYSVYQLHEMPRDQRELLVREAFRVLKPGGLLVLADSLQWDDTQELNWALERFPKIYHEPFYADYIHDRIEDMIFRVTGENAGAHLAFFTKIAWVQKPKA